MKNPLHNFPVIGVLLSIRDFFYLFFSWIARNFNKCKFACFFTFTWASIRAAVGIFSTIFSKMQAIKSTVAVTGSSLASQGSAEGAFLDKVNAVIPLSETLAFMAAYGAVVILTTGYMMIRSAYNATPGKLT